MKLRINLQWPVETTNSSKITVKSTILKKTQQRMSSNYTKDSFSIKISEYQNYRNI